MNKIKITGITSLVFLIVLLSAFFLNFRFAKNLSKSKNVEIIVNEYLQELNSKDEARKEFKKKRLLGQKRQVRNHINKNFKSADSKSDEKVMRFIAISQVVGLDSQSKKNIFEIIRNRIGSAKSKSPHHVDIDTIGISALNLLTDELNKKDTLGLKYANELLKMQGFKHKKILINRLMKNPQLKMRKNSLLKILPDNEHYLVFKR